MNARRGALLGRDAELTELTGCLDEAAAGRGALALVSGEPGIGKSRLLEETARAATDRGFVVAWGRAWEAGGAPAYWPWIEALRSLLARPGASEGAGELTRLMPELGRGAAPAAAGDRFQLYDAVAGFLGATAGREPILVVLDDLHAADPSSLHLTEMVARQLRGARAAIVASHRDVEARRNPEIDACLSRLGRDGRVLRLPRLSAAHVGALVHDVTGRNDDEVARLVHEASDGNPLFAHELLRLLAARGRERAGGVPEGVRAVIRQRLDLLSPATVALLQAAAVVGRDFAVPVAAELAGVTPAALVEALAEAEAAEIVAGAGTGRYRFPHILVADTLIGDLPPPRRERLHARAAETLERLHAGDAASPLAEIAHHWLQAGAATASRAVDAAVAAAARASARLAFEDAAELYQRAVAALSVAGPGETIRRVELLLAAAEAAMRGGEHDHGRQASLEAAALARTLGDGELLARAALTLGAEFVAGWVNPQLVDLLREALRALPAGPGPSRARVQARLAAALQPSPDPTQPQAMAREAIAMVDDLDDGVRLEVLHAAMGAMVDFAPPAERMPINHEVARLADAAGDRPRGLRARLRLAFDQLEICDGAGFDAAVRDYEAMVSAFHQPRYHWPLLMLRSAQAYWQGRFDEGARLEQEARSTAERARDQDAVLSLLFREILVLIIRGRSDELAARFAEFDQQLPQVPRMNEVFRAWAAGAGGRMDDAWRHLSSFSVDDFRDVTTTSLAGPLLADVVAARGTPEQVAAVYEAYRVRSGLACAATGVGYFLQDLDDRGLLVLASALGRWPDADRHAERALALCARMGARPLAARVRHDWARSLRSRGDAARARSLAAEALAEAEALDIELLARQCRELLADAPATAAPAATAPLAAPTDLGFTREGEYWTVTGAGATCRLRDSRGLRILAQLAAEPGREWHVLDLAESGGGDVIDTGDAGEVIDRDARAAYQERLRELRAELAEAESWNDAGRRERIEREIEALAAELSGAVGLGGRDRRAGRAAERARVNVQRRVADALRRIADAAPALGKHLHATIRTGAFCAYLPDDPRARRGSLT